VEKDHTEVHMLRATITMHEKRLGMFSISKDKIFFTVFWFLPWRKKS
jgi:hypothetical protein